VSPDGRYLVFMSNRSLTGYDNRDAVSGKPDMEVYLHDALTGRLACVSCNPTGSRPVGVEVGEFDPAFAKTLRPNVVAVRKGSGDGAYSEETWVAANLPPGNEVVGDASPYLPRALSDSGRVFFNSNDALVAQDANGQEDVYEFEPGGTGGCMASSVTFSPKTGGCVSLISSGTSPEESGFMDASKSGGDVFFLTTRRLTSQDYDTAFDVYDAHECSVTVPCVAPTHQEAAKRSEGSPRRPIVMKLTRIPAPVNVAGLAALSVPCGLGAGGLPIGLQLIGRDEETVVRLGSAFERAFGSGLGLP